MARKICDLKFELFFDESKRHVYNAEKTVNISDVQSIFPTFSELAILKTDGTVDTITCPPIVNSKKFTDVKAIVTTSRAFAALKKNGTVEVWGDDPKPVHKSLAYTFQQHFNDDIGGDEFEHVEESYEIAVQPELNHVKEIFSNFNAFAALKNDQTVVVWNERGVQAQLEGIRTIFPNEYAFAALTDEGKVVALGDSLCGGDASKVIEKLNDVETIFSTWMAFAALKKKDKSVVVWGGSTSGGNTGGVKLDQVKKIVSTSQAFAALKEDGSVFVWGDEEAGGDASAVQGQLNDNVESIYSTDYAFAALKTDKTVVVWGDPDCGGSTHGVKLDQVKKIVSTREAFAALRKDRSVFVWGNKTDGGDASAIQGQLNDIDDITASDHTVTATNKNGHKITWRASGESLRDLDFNLIFDESKRHVYNKEKSVDISDVKSIFETRPELLLLKTDGIVVTITPYKNKLIVTEKSTKIPLPHGLNGVKQIFSNSSAFAALKEDGSVVAWGDAKSGGDTSALQDGFSCCRWLSLPFKFLPCNQDELTDIKTIVSTDFAFAALKTNKKVVVWGDPECGGNTGGVELEKVKKIVSTDLAFAALKENGSVFVWGDGGSGGDTSAVQGQLIKDVEAIYSTDRAFAALKTDQKVVVWGDPECGGSTHGVKLDQVKKIVSTCGAFAALKEDGSVFVWGDKNYGGDENEVQGQLYDDVEKIVSTREAFAALKKDRSVFVWGNKTHGGDASEIEDELFHIDDITANDLTFTAWKKEITWVP